MKKLLFFLLVIISSSRADHYNGGTLRWLPEAGRPLAARLSFRMQYVYGDAASPGCTRQTLGQPKGRYFVKWKCPIGCTQAAFDYKGYFCEVVNDLGREQWEQGQNWFSVNFTNSSWPAKIVYRDTAWRKLHFTWGKLRPAGDHAIFNNWVLQTLIDLRARSDTGTPNSSPYGLSSGAYSLSLGCRHVIRIPVNDPDNDEVRCRWASGAECDSVCGPLPASSLSASCELTIDTLAVHGYVDDGWYAVAITVEDFSRKPIRLGASIKSSNDPLSQIPLQFLINTRTSSLSCDATPKFVPPTFEHNERRIIRLQDTLKLRVFAQASTATNTVVDIVVQGVLGVKKSFLKRDAIFGRISVAYIEVSWKPREDQIGEKHLCFFALDSDSQVSQTRCMVITVLSTNCRI